MTVFLHSIRTSAASLTPLDQLRGQCPDRALETLIADGLSSFAQSDVGIAEMIFQAVSATLAASALAPSALDALILVTESFWDVGATIDDHKKVAAFRDGILRRAILELSLTNAQVYGSWAGACGNLIPALSIAKALVSSGQVRNALIVVADRLHPAASRLMASGTTICSDLAAAAIVDTQQTGFMIDHLVVDPSINILSSRNDGNFLLHARDLRRGIRNLDQKVSRICGRHLREFDFLVAEGFGEAIIKLLCDGLGLERDKILCPGRALYSHPFSADILVSLGLLESTNQMKAKPRFAAISLSTWLLAAATFVPCEA